MRAGRGCWYEIGDGYVLVGNIKLDFLGGIKRAGENRGPGHHQTESG